MPEYVNKAIQVRQYHIDRIKANPRHSVKDTATDLKKSVGYISQMITIASWWKTHPEELMKCKGAYEAIEWIRSKKHNLLIEEN